MKQHCKVNELFLPLTIQHAIISVKQQIPSVLVAGDKKFKYLNVQHTMRFQREFSHE